MTDEKFPFDDDDKDGEADDGFAEFSFSDFAPEHAQSDKADDDDEDSGAFPPPAEPIEVRCIHCDSTFSSADLVKRWIDETGEYAWCCPTASCDGIGFCFDIWPVDPDWRDEHGDPATPDALPANFPEKRENCVWLESDEEIMFEDEYRVGGYERQERIDARSDMLWPPGTAPRGEDGDSAGQDDIPF